MARKTRVSFIKGIMVAAANKWEMETKQEIPTFHLRKSLRCQALLALGVPLK